MSEHLRPMARSAAELTEMLEALPRTDPDAAARGPGIQSGGSSDLQPVPSRELVERASVHPADPIDPTELDESFAIVPVDSLEGADSPRLDGVDENHVHTLAEADADLPPIFVQRSTMRVIDGMHRVQAARLKGQHAIRVRFFEGSSEEAFLLAVQSNIRHGLPLTLPDRRAAAQRIIQTWPQASDRWIANISGLAAKTVASIRRGVGDPAPAARIGRDGRVRPVDSRDRRRIAGELIAAHPDASLRKIAKGAGISVGTARDVREKVRRGIDPALTRQSGARLEQPDNRPRINGRLHEPVDRHSILDGLRHDPSLRYSNSGRWLLRWLVPPRLIDESDWHAVVELIPPHRAFDVARIARSCALVWSQFADELDRLNGSG